MKMGNSGEVVRKKRGGCDLQDQRAGLGRSEERPGPSILQSSHLVMCKSRAHTQQFIMGSFLRAGSWSQCAWGEAGAESSFGDLRSSHLFGACQPFATQKRRPRPSVAATIAILLLLLCQGCPEHWRPHSFAPLAHQPAVVVPSSRLDARR